MKRLLLILSFLLLSCQLAFPAAMNLAVTVAGAGDKSGEDGAGEADWQNAMGLAEWEADAEGFTEAGDTYYIEAGTYALTQAFVSTRDATKAAPIQFIGVKSGTSAEPPTVSDYAYGTDRPLIAAAANDFYFDADYWMLHNLSVTTTDSLGLNVGGNSCATINCHVNNTGGGYALRTGGSRNRYINCEGQSNTGYASRGPSQGYFKNCYFHDSAKGNYAAGDMIFVGVVFDTCSDYGIESTGDNNNFLSECVFYSNGKGIYENGTGGYWTVVNNIFDANTTGAEWGTEQKTNYFNYNIWDNTDDVTNVTIGPNAIVADPGLTDPDNGDFTVGSGSNALNAAFQPGVNTGLTGEYKWNIGVDQDDVAAGGTTNDVFGWVD